MKRFVGKTIAGLVILICCLNVAGCSTNFTHGRTFKEARVQSECVIPLPQIYSGTIYDVEEVFYPLLCSCGAREGWGYWQLNAPYFLTDMPFSFVADTFLLPYTIRKQYLYGHIEKRC